MNTAEGLALVARVVGGLVIVLVLVAISARIAKRTRHFGGNSDLQIIDRLGISKEAQIAVVRAGGQHLLIGISPQGITMLSHLDDAGTTLDEALDPVLEVSAEPAVRDDVPALPAFGSPAPVATPAAPVTVSDVPEDIAAELMAQFEAAQPPGFQPAQFLRVVPQEPEPQQPEQIVQVAQVAEPVEQAEQAGEPRRRRSRHAAPSAEPEPEAAEPATVAVAGPAAPAVPALPEIPEVQLPGAVNLGDYPDLASALRAAGRTTRPGDEVPQPGSSSWIPTQRAGAETPDLSHATSSAPVAPGSDQDVPEEARNDRKRNRSRRVPQQRPEQGGGSVLSPATWRQGIEALREMTVRRG